MESNAEFSMKKEDVQRLADLAGMEFIEHGSEEDFDEALADGDLVYSPEFIKNLLNGMANAALSTSKDDERFFYFWCENEDILRGTALENDEVAEMLLLCFRMAIDGGSALCMNCLGALYYMGDIVPQDYVKAAGLYEMAMSAGCYQSIINLGYIYEYGRTGEPDYAKAYQYYSLAAALAPSSEAAYKLGDMFSRGRSVPRDMSKAYALYERSFQLAQGDAEIAQPAFRIAKMLIDSEGVDYGVKANPLEALKLFQLAEIGLRKAIADGQRYYQKRLQEAIEGQKKAREILAD